MKKNVFGAALGTPLETTSAWSEAHKRRAEQNRVKVSRHLQWGRDERGRGNKVEDRR